MTIYQSRYGANAEVGRNPSRKPNKDQSVAGVLGGAGLAAGGAGMYAAGGSVLNRARRRFDMANKVVPGLQRNRVLNEQVVRDLQARIDRRGNLGPTDAQVSRQLRNKIALLEAKRRLDASRKIRTQYKTKLVSAGKLSGRLRGAGLAAGLIGAGIAGTSAYRNERARGTFGYKRPNYSNTQGM